MSSRRSKSCQRLEKCDGDCTTEACCGLWIFRGVQGGKHGGKICFPKDFSFGVATASYQIEGAWNVSGKGESIWDRYTHTYPERIFDNKNGDVGDDSYHRYREDVAAVASLGLNFYRFSISWPRILPDGFSNNINEDGIRYYDALLSELHRYKITPVVTMYHWDLPQALQDLGGWTNPIMIDYFEDYARVLFNIFGDSVSHWITFNEPLSFCGGGYGGLEAPGANSSGLEDYMCGHNVLLAHARVYHMYKKQFYHRQNGFVGITLDMAWLEPNSTSDEDEIAAETGRQFTFGWFANPIFSEAGDYPPIMRRRIDEISRHQGFRRSRLPSFRAEEVESLKGSADFLGFNHYTTSLVAPGDGRVSRKPSFYDDMGVKLFVKDEWPKSNSTWLRIVPWGFRKNLNWIRTTYNNPPVLVTENGISLEPGLHDLKRVQYISSYLKALHAAVVEDKCDVYGYAYWSLIDNFEWLRGFSERFGLFEVDYSSPKRTRTPRLSATYYSRVATTGCIPDSIQYLYTGNKV